MKITLGTFLLQQLLALKITHIYGVPGDYNLALLEMIEHDANMEFIGNCNELNAAYAADGYARLKGAGAVITTYGVGDLAALSGIAGAYAESVAVICIAGTPPLHAMKNRALLHHSLADGNFDNVMTCFKQFTAAQALLTPENAATEIPRLISCAWQQKKPVYMQLPSDIVDVEIDIENSFYSPKLPTSDIRYLALAAAALLARIEQAKRPIILVDQMVDRYQLQPLVVALAHKFAIPLASMPTAKGVIAENTPGWQGSYCGNLSRPELFEHVAQADCILSFGVRFTDAATGYFSQQCSEAAVVDIQPYSLKLDNRAYPAVTAAELLLVLLDGGTPVSLPAETPFIILPETESKPAYTLHHTEYRLLDCNNVKPSVRYSPIVDSHQQEELSLSSVISSTQLDQANFWQYIRGFLQTDDVLVVENGTSGIAIGGMPIPDGVTVVNQPIWGSIGYTLPALLGTMMAAPHRRHLLFIGDGAFQLTAQELSTLLGCGQKPIIFLINNQGYTIERYILGASSSYNDIAAWSYSKLPEVLNPQVTSFCLIAETHEQLLLALAEASQRDSLVLIEVKLPKMDVPVMMKEFCRRCNNFNFGLQHRYPSELKISLESNQPRPDELISFT